MINKINFKGTEHAINDNRIMSDEGNYYFGGAINNEDLALMDLCGFLDNAASTWNSKSNEERNRFKYPIMLTGNTDSGLPDAQDTYYSSSMLLLDFTETVNGNNRSVRFYGLLYTTQGTWDIKYSANPEQVTVDGDVWEGGYYVLNSPDYICSSGTLSGNPES